VGEARVSALAAADDGLCHSAADGHLITHTHARVPLGSNNPKCGRGYLETTEVRRPTRREGEDLRHPITRAPLAARGSVPRRSRPSASPAPCSAADSAPSVGLSPCNSKTPARWREACGTTVRLSGRGRPSRTPATRLRPPGCCCLHCRPPVWRDVRPTATAAERTSSSELCKAVCRTEAWTKVCNRVVSSCQADSGGV